MDPGENINEFARRSTEKLNELNQKIGNLIDDSQVSTDKTWSSFKITDYIIFPHKLRYYYTLGQPQVFDLEHTNIDPDLFELKVNGVELEISQYNLEDNTGLGTVEILDPLGNSDYIYIKYYK